MGLEHRQEVHRPVSLPRGHYQLETDSPAEKFEGESLSVLMAPPPYLYSSRRSLATPFDTSLGDSVVCSDHISFDLGTPSWNGSKGNEL